MVLLLEKDGDQTKEENYERHLSGSVIGQPPSSVENPDSSAKKRRSWPDLSKKTVDVMGNLIPLTLWKAVLAVCLLDGVGGFSNKRKNKQMKERPLLILRR